MVSNPQCKDADPFHNRVPHIADKDSQGWDGEQRPEDEEDDAGTGLREDIAVADGEE